MRKSILKALMILLIVALAFSGSPALAKDKIVIGQALALSGPTAGVTKILEQPAIKLWLQEVNAKGGIYVKEYGKRLPVELLRYDNKGDINTMLKLVKRLITVDKVDFLFPPWGSDMHFAIIPVANKAGYPLVTWTVVSEKMFEREPKLPYIFFVAPPPSTHMKVGRDLFKELGVKTAAVIYMQGLAGIEYSGALKSNLEEAGIKVALYKSYPPFPKDLSPLLKQIKKLNPDALIANSYPGDSLLITEQAMVMGMNLKAFAVAIGGAMPMYRDKFGASRIEGVFAWGGYDPNAAPESKDYFEKFQKVNGFEPDYYSAPWGYASYQILEQAIEKAGTLERDKVRDVLATETFTNTAAGNIVFKFKNHFNFELPSYYGQWQKGKFESIAPKNTKTAKPVYPKPPWPK
jgi:branched-chain amino acid transport system substrate-binding protein